MMALARAIDYLTIDEAIEAVADLAMDGTATALAARDIIDRVNPQEWRDLAAAGLAARANARLYTLRFDEPEAPTETDADSGPSSRSIPKAKPNRAALYWKLTRNYEAADGTRKALLSFTLADVANLRVIAETRAKGYATLAAAMSIATSLLTSSKAETIGALPETARRQIAEALG